MSQNIAVATTRKGSTKIICSNPDEGVSWGSKLGVKVAVFI